MNLHTAKDEERRIVQIGGKWGFIDSAGKIAIEPRFEQAGFFFEGLARVRIGDVIVLLFTVMGIPCMGINGGPAFKHSKAFSFQGAEGSPTAPPSIKRSRWSRVSPHVD